MEQFKNQKILVVGGAGFVGSNMVRSLLPFSPKKILVVDNLLSAERLNLPVSSEVRFIEGSIADDRILSSLKDDFDFVFHLATYHGNQSSIHDPLADHANNTVTTLKLYERIKHFKKLKKIVYSSAGCSLAEKTTGDAKATREDSAISLYLDSPYQISKIIGEFYSNYYFKQYDLPVVKARFQNVYGPGEILGAGKWRGTPATVWRNVIPTFIYRGIKQMPLILENGGAATRDFIYIDDIIRGLLLCATVGSQGEVYNLASGVETSILDLANVINGLTNNPTRIQFGLERDWDTSKRRFGSIVKAKTEIGFQAQVGLLEGLTRTVEWTRSNLHLIEASIQKHASYLAV